MRIHIQPNYSLKPHNTLGFDQRAECFVSASSNEELIEALSYAKRQKMQVLILGGGSNLVLTKDIPGLVVQPDFSDISYDFDADGSSALVSVGAGVNWNHLVQDTLQNNAPGLENLTLIPGTVGAAPVQNIGAYGVELKDRLHSVRALHIESLIWREFSVDDCEFSYRNSYFKQNKGEYVITRVRLSLGTHHELKSDYASLATSLESQNINQPTALDISQHVAAIRQSRLPDPATLGNAGSFFHNPVVDEMQHRELLAQFPGLVSYEAGTGRYKLSAAWLIDQLGFKGREYKGVGVYEKQALVLVNRGPGTGLELMELAGQIQEAVVEHYNVQLNVEPIVI